MEDDASPDANRADMSDGTVDAAPPRCDPDAAFDTIEAVEELNTPTTSEESAFLTEDELTIYFSRNSDETKVNWDIYVATRPSREAEFGDVAPVRGVNTTETERDPAISSDGTFLYASTGAKGFDLSVATRPNAESDFGRFDRVKVLDRGAVDTSPYVLPNGRIYFASGEAVNDLTIYSSTGAGQDFETPQEVSGIDVGLGGESEGSPVVTHDELKMFFHSPRPDGDGQDDIWSTIRTSDEGQFLQSVNEGRLNEARFDHPDWISADGCVLYFSRDSGFYTITYDIYRATRGF